MIDSLAELLEEKGYRDKRSVSWNAICKDEELSESFLRENSDQINWRLVSEFQVLPEPFIRDFSGRLYWKEVMRHQKVSEGFIEEFAAAEKWQTDDENWSRRQKTLYEKEGTPFDEHEYWTIISMKNQLANGKGLSPAFMERHQEKLSWSCLSKFQRLPMQLIDRHQHQVDWHEITRVQVLSERFIEKHRDKVEWGTISFHQQLTERFINKHHEKMSFISAEQKRSEAFLYTHLDKMDAASIIENQNLHTVRKYHDMDVYVIAKNRRKKYIVEFHNPEDFRKFFKAGEEELFEYLAENDMFEVIEKDFPELTLAEDNGV
ncbi:hypothetical protein [Planomicrobium sp. CPCC 101110]|uniref:hypothetical protein n=1 Tax=Planomicrobium sp. CPCC 101110 TaxID=2599619 RepID=UPI0011B460E4|nr:hypothetical protein [Planomicrobium sp. CPCC 101110]TWT24824.1 hypothetical protein FQV30_15125 [Planomicrobium sp. CPCC 101110]